MRNGLSRQEFLALSLKFTLGLSIYPFLTNLRSASANTSKIDLKINSANTGFIFDQNYLKHTLGDNHPESPKRLKAIMKQLENSGLNKLLVKIPIKIEPIAYIKSIHSELHIDLIKKQAYNESICQLAVAGSLSAIDAVCTNKVKNAFCAIRPPGHHAMNNGEYGFCFYNNIAIAARYAQQKYKLKKILIVDWDYHHGNGTEWTFYDDPTVLFFSTHALWAFPGTGFANKTGKGKGLGFNINVPLPSRTDDKTIIDAFTKILVPAANKFRPNLILVSAGFDSRKNDLLGDFSISDAGFVELTKILMSLAKQHSQSRVVSILEGGYNTQGLALATQAHLDTLLKG